MTQFSRFLSVQQNQFSYKDQPVTLRSIGLGNWLNLEHFMLGIPGTQQQIQQVFDDIFGPDNRKRFFSSFFQQAVDEADLEYIARSGFNSIRIPMNHHLLLDADTVAESTGIKQIDRILPLCEKHNLWAILDLHTAPGGQNPDWHSDNASGDWLYWKDAAARKQVVALWRQIASHYRDSKVVAGYDFLNEPCYIGNLWDPVMVDHYADLTAAVREVDPHHILFYEGNTYARDFSMFAENLDENIAYSFHFYPFLQLAGKTVTRENAHDALQNQLSRDVSLQHLRGHLKKPLWCGETGHPHHAPDTAHLLGPFVEVLEEQQISWALWPYKDAGAMGLVTLKEDSGWNRKMASLTENWNFFDFFQQDSANAIAGQNDPMHYYAEMADFSTRGLEIFARNAAKESFEELLSLLKDFAFANCRTDRHPRLMPR